MLRASLYIIACSAKNHVRSRLRRLREPRYLAGAIAGGAYLYFAVFMRIGANRGGRRRGGVPPSPPSLPPVAQGLWPSLAGAGLLVMAGLAWILPSSSTLFEFSQAEVQFLFPAPVSRRQLLIHRLMRSQVGLLFAALVPAFFITAPGLSALFQLSSIPVRLSRSLALWVVFVTVRVYFAGVTLARARLTSGDAGTRRLAWAPLLVTSGALAVVVAPLARSLWSVPPQSMRDAASTFSGIVETGWPRLVLWPFASLVRPLFAEWPGPFLLAMVSASLVMLATIAWTLRSNEAFSDVSEEAQRSQEERVASKAAMPRVGTVTWPLALTGRTETVFFWKNGVQTLRGTNLVAVLPFLLPLAVITVVGATARMSATGSRGPAAAFATGSLFLALFWTLMGPQSMRSDLRGDLSHLDLLKTWPVSPAAVIRGELIWPTALLTLCAWLALACGAIFSTVAFPAFTLTQRLALLVAAIVLVPALVGAQFTVHSAAAVMFPAWVSTGTQRPRGLDALGQRVILFGGVMLALIVMVGPGAIAGALIAFVFYRFAGMVSLVPAAVVCLAIVVVEILLVTEMIGAAYDRIDLSHVERGE